MAFIYSMCMILLQMAIKVASWFKPKIKAWEKERSILPQKNTNKHIWFHCASLGEYKQCLPLVNQMEKDNAQIAFSFYSKSGYSRVKTIHSKYYLPNDLKYKLRPFIEAVNPSLVIMVRNEFWFNLIDVLREQRIPIVYINCSIRKDQFFIKYPFQLFFSRLKSVNHFFTMDNVSKILLEEKGIKNVSVSGDTKFDQATHPIKKKETLKQIGKDKKTILLASMEPGDKDCLSDLINDRDLDYQIIYVPHEPEEKIFHNLKSRSNKHIIKYSAYEEQSSFDILYVDSFGILASLYENADICYIGGGFDKGIHNALEACAFGIPIIFGPKHKKFPEAREMMDLGIAISIDRPSQFIQALNHFESAKAYKQIKQDSSQYLACKKGASLKIYKELKNHKMIN